MYCLSSSLTVCQSRNSSSATSLMVVCAAASAHEEGEPLGVERVVGQPVQVVRSSRRRTESTGPGGPEKSR